MNLAEKIGSLFFIGIPGPEIDDLTTSLLNDIRPGGVCLFARNIRSAQQTRTLCDELRSILGDDLLISIDQEGGSVDRLRRISIPMPAAERLSETSDAFELGRLVGRSLSALGLNMDFAPVVDVIDDRRRGPANGLTSRTFGSDAATAAEFAAAFLDGLSQSGILGCLKHFPGLGASVVDSHEQLPEIAVAEDELRTVDLAPYRELLPAFPAAAVMVAHAAYPKVSLQERGGSGKLLPASLSRAFVDGLLRTELGFDGLVITDDLEMGAIVNDHGVGEACVMAVEAGNDMVAICAGVEPIRQGFKAVAEAVGSNRISVERIERSYRRISRFKSLTAAPAEFSESDFENIKQEIIELNERLERK